MENQGDGQYDLDCATPTVIEKSIPPPPTKTADRPHWITMVIGLFSPMLACVALYVSYMSFQIGERSVKFGAIHQHPPNFRKALFLRLLSERRSTNA